MPSTESTSSQPTPIQATAIPHLLAGRDLLGVAQTGTGKTAAFALPMLQHLAGDPAQPHRYGTRALILAPTRELALQIEASLHRLGGDQKRRIVAILGGVSRFMQVQRMRAGADIVVGTPGRICDLMATGELKLNQVSHFVLDEADRMLDLGFIRDIRRIVAALPVERQSSLFSATMPRRSASLPRPCCATRCGWMSPATRRSSCRSSSTCISWNQPASGRCWTGC